MSRVITLSSERNSIERRIQEINNEINSKEEMLERIEFLLLESDIDDFIEEYAEDILLGKKTVSEILEDDNSIELKEEELESYIEDLKRIFDNLMDYINRTSIDYQLPSNFNRFTKDNDIDINDNRNWYKDVYTIIYNNLPDEPPESSILGGVWGYSFKPPKIPTVSIPNMGDIKWYNEKVKERDSLEDNLMILTGLQEEQKKILNKFGSISGLWSGLLVLGFSTIAGIIVPALLLPYPLNKYDDLATRRLLLFLFINSLISLFLYLGISIYKLTKKD